MMRAAAVLLALALFSCQPLPAPPLPPTPPPPGTVVGAIRWDAWTGDDPPSAAGFFVDRSLGPSQFHFRLPFYAQVTGTDSVVVNGTTQAIMDQEITYAHNAGLNYWAFVYYSDHPSDPNAVGLSMARRLYMSSSQKALINFSLILTSSADPDMPTLMGWLTDASYQKVLNGRPLVYVFSTDDVQSYISQIRTAAAAKNINPYIVVLGAGTGADAVTAYVTPGINGQPYTQLASYEVSIWNSVAKNSAIVPWVSTGWDPRPRIQNPVPWTSYASNSWAQTATPTEIANHLQDAFNWIGANQSRAPANAVLMYAWNEFDEGGWLCPTLSNGTDRLNAIANVMIRR